MMMAERVRRGEKTMALNLLAVASEPTPHPAADSKQKRKEWLYLGGHIGTPSREKMQGKNLSLGCKEPQSVS